MMDIPTAQEKSEQIFFVQPKVHQNKFADLNKMVPANLLRMMPSSSSVKRPTRRLAFSRRLPRTRSNQKKRVRLIFLQHIAVNRATSSTVATDIVITIEATNVIATTADLIILIKMIDAMIVVNVTTRTQGTISPTTRRMIASAIPSRKRATRPCTMTSPLRRAPEIRLEEGVDLVPDLLCALVLV
jgi:hypothetical protein